MSDFRSMGARELRKIAPKLGLTGASRMSQASIVAWIESYITILTPEQRAFIGATFDREARDALHRAPVLVYDPAGHLTAKQRAQRNAKNRAERRHTIVRVTQIDGATHWIKRRIPRQFRVGGVMQPATRLELIKARVDLGVTR
jgi:hypothetical protein